MKRLLVSLLLLPVSCGFAGFINWGNDSSAVVDPSGGVPPTGWVLELWNAGAGGIEWTPGGTGDDTLVGSATLNYAGGWFYNTTASSGGFTAYVVGYNSANKLTATHYVILGAGDPQAAIPSLPGASDTHDFGMPGCVAGDWQLIPEPSTIALLALGAMTLVAGRKLRKKKS